MKQLIIGWGNPIVGDDALGPAAARCARRMLDGLGDVDVIETSHGGLRTAERMLDYDRVILADARLDDESGEIRRTVVRPAGEGRRSVEFGHDDTLTAALETLAALDRDRLPKEIVVLSAPIAPPTAWSETLSEAGRRLAERLAEAVVVEVVEVAVA